MQLTETLKTADFLAQRPDRADLDERHSKTYDALIARFKPLPADVEGEDPDELCEVASFLINQGVIVEILRCSFESQPAAFVYIVDIAFEHDAYNVTCCSQGSDRIHCLVLLADSFEDAVKGVTEVMLSTHAE